MTRLVHFAIVPVVSAVKVTTMSADTRPRISYRGRDRTELALRGASASSGRAQRKFARPVGACQWSIADQETAVDRGYFLERVKPLNRVRVTSVTGRPDERTLCNELERSAFNGDYHSSKALALIEQQDMFGYSGAWASAGIERLTGTLRWYKDRKLSKRKATRTMSEHMSAVAQARWAR